MMAVDAHCPLCGSAATVLHRLEHTTAWECGGRTCELRFAWPQLADRELHAAYQALYYPAPSDGHRPAYESTSSTILSEVMEGLFTRLGAAPGQRLLDYGCGTGDLCRLARGSNLDATGIEADAEARRTAREEHGIPVFGTLDELVTAHPRTRFDVIILWQVIEHLRAPWEDLRRLTQLLENGGTVVIATPNSNGLKSRLLGRRWENFTNRTHFFYFTDRALGNVLRRSDLRVVDRWFLPMSYPHHGWLRKRLQMVLRAGNLNGELLFVSKAIATH